MSTFTIEVLPQTLAICRLEAAATQPGWLAGDFVSVTRTADELSVVCQQQFVPADVRCERGWRGMRIAGSLDFSLVGVVAGLTRVLADDEVSVFVVSTFDTDYLLVKESQLDAAIAALAAAGHAVVA